MTKELRKWMFNGRLYFQVKVSSSLWYFSRRNADQAHERQTHLFFIGWYSRGYDIKLWSMTVLWLSVAFAFTRRLSK